MHKLSFCLILFFIISSCNKKEEITGSATAKDVVAVFPVENLGEMVGELSPTERDRLVEKGESDNWKLVPEEVKNDQITIRNKVADDNYVSFFIYRTKGDSLVVGVQQVNAQSVTTNFWKYKSGSDEKWADYPMPSVLVEDFISEDAIVPDNFKDSDARNYLDISLSENLTYTVNNWNFIKEIAEHYEVDESPLVESYVKYNMEYYWDGTGFTANKVGDAGYRSDPTLNATVVVEDENGPGINEFDCPHGVSVSATSQLAAENGNTYEPVLVLDGKDETAWAVADGGLGKSITFTIREQFLIGNSFQIRTGYTKSKDSWQANNRVKKLKAFVNNKLVSHIILQDTDAYQSFVISPSWMKDLSGGKVGDKIRFEIEEIYKGDKYNDTLISYFVPTGNCG